MRDALDNLKTGAARLALATDLDTPQSASVGGGMACWFTARAPDKASDNEDGLLLVACGDDRCVLAVADGLGGHPGGDQAARIALDEMHDAVTRAAAVGDSLRDAILNGFDSANAVVRREAPGAGTTLAVVELDGPTMRSYHAGDSSILAVGQRGSLRWATVDHSPVGYAVEAGMLDAGDAIHHDDRHLISNMVGSETMRIEVGPPVRLKLRDTVLVASDGLTDNLRTGEIVEIVRKGPLPVAGVRLLTECHVRMAGDGGDHPAKPDDLTFVLYRSVG